MFSGNQTKYDVNRKILNSYGISLEQFLSFDKDTKNALLVAYWNSKHLNQEKIEDNKVKILNIFKRK